MLSAARQRRIPATTHRLRDAIAGASLAVAVAGCADMQQAMRTEYEATKQAFRNTDAAPRTQRVTLAGANGVPVVRTNAAGSGEVTVSADRRVSGSVRIVGMSATAAHLHQGATGVAGPAIVHMIKQGDDTFAFAPDAKLTPEQYAAWRSGGTYLNVHSAAHPTGEIRSDQLKGN